MTTIPGCPPAALAALLLFAHLAGAQDMVEISGTVRSSAGGVVEGASVCVADCRNPVTTDAAGRFRLAVMPGTHLLRVSRNGYVTHEREVAVVAVTDLEVVLEPLARFSEQVTVQAVRADVRSPLTTTNVPEREIERANHGQEMPFLLEPVPSLTFYSDTGTGAGYSYLSLRGIPQTRMNITLDGAPLNEAEDSALYFVDFGDFASNVESIQVQRGVGTSTPGAASFVGSINFASVDLEDERRVAVRAGGGSFGTMRASVAVQSGLVGPDLKFYGRASWQDTDGFRDRSGVEQKSLFFGASQQQDRAFWKIFGFAGQERTELAFYAVEKEVLERDLRFNPLSPEERDSFGQRFVQGQYHRAVGASGQISVQGYFNGAGGWYRLWDDPVGRTSLLEYGLDWRMAGATTAARYQRGRASVTWGFHANDFRSRHTRDVVDGARQYSNRGLKNEVSTFGRLVFDTGRWHHYADAQVRWAGFRYEGDLDLGSVSWTFLNPKVGTRYDVTRGLSVYGSLGKASREPTRMDMFSGEDNPTVPHDLEAVEPERVLDVEAGLDLHGRAGSVQATFYAMEFRDEIALTGELSEIGLPLRRNVDRSYRRGVEIDARWRPLDGVQVRHTANAGRNRIHRWVQFYDVYDENGAYLASEPRTHENVTPLLTPAYVGNVAVDWIATPWLTVGAAGRYVSKAYLDNTNREGLTTPGWFNLDASAVVSLRRFFPAGSPALRIFVENLLDNDRLFPSGYSYQYFVRDGTGVATLQGIPYYYPLATRSVFVTVDFSL